MLMAPVLLHADQCWKEKNMRSLVAGSNGMARMIILVLLLGAVAGFAYWGNIPGVNVSVDSK
jgi:hypothetical protein